VLDDGNQYLFGAGLVSQKQSGSWYYYLADGLGSTMAIVDGSGNTQNTYTYDIYGTPTKSGSLTNEFDFAGQQTDGSTSLQYLRARYYDPATGTFLSRDPLAKRPGWGGSGFGYVDADPVRFADSTGRIPIDSNGCALDDAGCARRNTELGYPDNPCGPDFPNCDFPNTAPPRSDTLAGDVAAHDFGTKLIGEYLHVIVDIGGGVLLSVGGGPVKDVHEEKTLNVDHPEKYADDLFRSLTEGMDPKPYTGAVKKYPGKQVILKDGSIVGIRRAADGTLKVDVNSGTGYVKFTIK
jgi:RHS repeat-associated protein